MTIPRDVQRLWAPWRQAYIASSQQQRLRGCMFCAARRARADRETLVLHRGRAVTTMLNRYPYVPGHLLITPNRHIKRLAQLTAEESAELLLTTGWLEGVLTKAFHPQAFNMGTNVGRAAGAGIPGHLHFHLVPRWTGDANFMPIIGRTRVMSASLEALYDHLKPLLRSGAGTC